MKIINLTIEHPDRSRLIDYLLALVMIALQAISIFFI